jgi:hypothetical protein
VVASLLLVAVSNAACPGSWLNAAVRFLGIRAFGALAGVSGQLSDQHWVSHVPDGWGQSLRMTRPRVLGHPLGPTRSSRPSAEWSDAGRSNRLRQQGFGLLVAMIASVPRPSGALQCDDLQCQF